MFCVGATLPQLTSDRKHFFQKLCVTGKISFT